MVSCGEPTELKKLQKENKEWFKTLGDVDAKDKLAINDDLSWGLSREKVTSKVDGMVQDDYETYISTFTSVKFPVDQNWKEGETGIKSEAFEDTEVTAYYVFNDDQTLQEYGYQCFKPILAQYDFIKEYYTKMYGEPAKEEYIWNDEDYEPDGTEDLYAMFEKGLVKVLAVWDIDEVSTVLVVDWLCDPIKTENNFGQISFFEKTKELDLSDETE